MVDISDNLLCFFQIASKLMTYHKGSHCWPRFAILGHHHSSWAFDDCGCIRNLAESLVRRNSLVLHPQKVQYRIKLVDIVCHWGCRDDEKLDVLCKLDQSF